MRDDSRQSEKEWKGERGRAFVVVVVMSDDQKARGIALAEAVRAVVCRSRELSVCDVSRQLFSFSPLVPFPSVCVCVLLCVSVCVCLWICGCLRVLIYPFPFPYASQFPILLPPIHFPSRLHHLLLAMMRASVVCLVDILATLAVGVGVVSMW